MTLAPALCAEPVVADPDDGLRGTEGQCISGTQCPLSRRAPTCSPQRAQGCRSHWARPTLATSNLFVSSENKPSHGFFGTGIRCGPSHPFFVVPSRRARVCSSNSRRGQNKRNLGADLKITLPVSANGRVFGVEHNITCRSNRSTYL
jgi:hypothetical protein